MVAFGDGGYREPALEVSTIPYGPFPRQRRALLVFPVVLAAWVACVVAMGETANLSCEDGECRVESGYLWITTAQQQFAADEIIGSDHSENENEVRVRLYRRARPTVQFYVDAFAGSSDFESILAYLDDPRGELSVSAYPSVFLWLAFGLGALILLGFATRVYRTPSSLELAVHPGAIEITEHWPIRVRRRRLPLDGVTEIRLVEQTRSTWFDGDIDGAIVQVVDADGRVRPITTDTYPHVEIHRAAADALRAALGLPVPTSAPHHDDDDDDDDWDDDDSPRWAPGGEP